MEGTSKLWLAAAGLMAAASGLAGIAVALHWQPCGPFLAGSMPAEYSLRAGFTVECLAAMHQGPAFPLPGDLQAVGVVPGLMAAVLLPLAWLVLLPTLRLSSPGRLAVALPALLGLALPTVSLAAPAAAGVGSAISLAIELSVLLAILVVAASRASGVSGMLLVRYAIVLLAASSTGFLHLAADYHVSLAVTGATWDEPPGTGSFTVAVTALAAVATLALWLREWRRSAILPASPVVGLATV
jgi:hypothetical protein